MSRRRFLQKILNSRSKETSDDQTLQDQFFLSEQQREEAFEENLRRHQQQALQAEIDNDAGEQLRRRTFKDALATVARSRANCLDASNRAFQESQEWQDRQFKENDAIRQTVFDARMQSFQDMVTQELKMQQTQAQHFLDCRDLAFKHDQQRREAICATLKAKLEEQSVTMLRPWVETFHASFEASLKDKEQQLRELGIHKRSTLSIPSVIDPTPGVEPQVVPPTTVIPSTPGNNGCNASLVSSATSDSASGPGARSSSTVSNVALPASSSSYESATSMPFVKDTTVPIASVTSKATGIGVALVDSPETSCLRRPSPPSRHIPSASASSPAIASPVIESTSKSLSSSVTNATLASSGADVLSCLEDRFASNQTQRWVRFQKMEDEIQERWKRREQEYENAETAREQIISPEIAIRAYDDLFDAAQSTRGEAEALRTQTFSDTTAQWAFSFQSSKSRTESSYAQAWGAQNRLFRAMLGAIDHDDLAWLWEKSESEVHAFYELLVSYDGHEGVSELEKSIDRLAMMPFDGRNYKQRRRFSAFQDYHEDYHSFESVCMESGITVQSIIAPIHLRHPLPTSSNLSSRKLDHESRWQQLFQESQGKMEQIFQDGMRKRQQSFTIHEMNRQQHFTRQQELLEESCRLQLASIQAEFTASQERRALAFHGSESERNRAFQEAQGVRAQTVMMFIEEQLRASSEDQERREERWLASEDERRDDFTRWQLTMTTRLETRMEKYQALFYEQECFRQKQFEAMIERLIQRKCSEGVKGK